MRNIAQIKIIDEINPIPNADAIEVARVGGWRVVVQKERFIAGDTAVFFEVDTFLPEDNELFASFAERGRKSTVSPLTNETVSGHVLKTAKLRGVFSQGLLMKTSEIGLSENASQDEVNSRIAELGIFKWEPPIPAGGEQVGSFPAQARKTDSERVQNLTDEFLSSLNANDWVATEKIDGTSSTFVMTDDGLVTASRNWAVNPENSLQGKIAKRLNLEKVMPVGSILQGEIFGEGIQGNPLKISGTRLAIFSVSTPTGEIPSELAKIVEELSVPRVNLTFPSTVDEAISQVNKMKSLINPKVNAEGVVWWNVKNEIFVETGDRPNFKSINPQFLLKNDR